MGIALIMLMAGFIKICSVHTPSSNPKLPPPKPLPGTVSLCFYNTGKKGLKMYEFAYEMWRPRQISHLFSMYPIWFICQLDLVVLTCCCVAGTLKRRRAQNPQSQGGYQMGQMGQMREMRPMRRWDTALIWPWFSPSAYIRNSSLQRVSFTTEM